jgi:hypothetical protein
MRRSGAHHLTAHLPSQAAALATARGRGGRHWQTSDDRDAFVRHAGRAAKKGADTGAPPATGLREARGRGGAMCESAALEGASGSRSMKFRGCGTCSRPAGGVPTVTAPHGDKKSLWDSGSNIGIEVGLRCTLLVMAVKRHDFDSNGQVGPVACRTSQGSSPYVQRSKVEPLRSCVTATPRTARAVRLRGIEGDHPQSTLGLCSRTGYRRPRSCRVKRCEACRSTLCVGNSFGHKAEFNTRESLARGTPMLLARTTWQGKKGGSPLTKVLVFLGPRVTTWTEEDVLPNWKKLALISDDHLAFHVPRSW